MEINDMEKISKMDDYAVIEQIGRGTFGAAFLLFFTNLRVRSKKKSLSKVIFLFGFCLLSYYYCIGDFRYVLKKI
jgi:hypothetical protein